MPRRQDATGNEPESRGAMKPEREPLIRQLLTEGYDTRFISSHLNVPREEVWELSLEQQLPGLLEEFGDAHDRQIDTYCNDAEHRPVPRATEDPSAASGQDQAEHPWDDPRLPIRLRHQDSETLYEFHRFALLKIGSRGRRGSSIYRLIRENQEGASQEPSASS